MKLNAPLTKNEMETHVIMTGDGMALIDTSVPKMLRRLKKLGYETVREDTYDGKVLAACFKVPEKCVSFRKPPAGLSEERKKQLSDRMKNLRKTKEVDE